MARILTCIPQASPFDRRIKLFSSLLAADKLKTHDETMEFRNDTVRGIDFANLKVVMQYAAGYHPSQPMVLGSH